MSKTDVPLGLLLRFTPLDELPSDKLMVIGRTARLDILAFGTPIFGDSAAWKRSYFLVSGSIELELDSGIRERIDAGAERARLPFTPMRHSKMQIRVCSRQAELLSVDSASLEKMLNWDDTGMFLVRELSPDGGSHTTAGDWMVQFMRSPLCARLPPRNLHAIFDSFERVDYPKGHVVIQQGQKSDYFYAIASGTCDVIKVSPAAGTRALIKTMEAGAFFGEDALVSDALRSATVIMSTEGRLMRIGKDRFNELVRDPVLQFVDLDGAKRILASGGKAIDVRFKSEHAGRRLPGAMLVPLYNLREEMASLPKVPLVVSCDNGRRSAVAAFILATGNFDAYVLRGGVDGCSGVDWPKEDAA